MNEFLMPCPYTGAGTGVGVMFAGLDDGPYDQLEVSLDGESYITVSRDKEDGSYSAPHLFADLDPKIYHHIYGRVSMEGETRVVSAIFQAERGGRQLFRAAPTMSPTKGGSVGSFSKPKVGTLYG